MEYLLSAILFLILTWALIRTAHSITRSNPEISSKLPPGPKPLPVIGNLHQLGDKLHKSLANLAKIHGPLMSLKFVQVTTIVVSSSAMAKEVLQTHDQHLSNRTIPNALHIHGHNHVGLPWIPVSNLWRTQRKICNLQLFSAKALDSNQELRRRKARQLFEQVERSRSTGEAVDIGREAFTTTLNLLSNTIFSVDLADPNSELAKEFKEITRGIMKEAGSPNLGDYFPLLRKIDPQGIRRRMTGHFKRILDLLDGMINERLRAREKPGFVNGDVLDTLLNIIEEKTEEINKNQVNHLLLVLFVAGTDTTASTLQWAMAELLRNPEVLSKARAELDKIIGKGNPVEESDIARLPYLQAIIRETFRLHPAVPLLLPRRAETDVEIKGFTIPKGAQIMVNVWAIGRDSKTWENPDEFTPERFLGHSESENNVIEVKGRSFELIPFGGGRRICPGSPLAVRMLHLMLGTLIHSFDWKLEDGKNPDDVDMDDKFGISLEMARPLRAIPSHAQG